MSEIKKITKSELIENNGEEGKKLWVLIDGKVYDVTDFNHPGGNEILMEDQENDRFDEFESIHSPAAKKQMSKFLIGKIDGAVENKQDENAPVSNKVAKQGNNVYFILAIMIMFVGVYFGFSFIKK